MKLKISFFKEKNVKEIIANYISDFVGLFILMTGLNIKNIPLLLLVTFIGFLLIKLNIIVEDK
jgi:hypothetical protein